MEKRFYKLLLTKKQIDALWWAIGNSIDDTLKDGAPEYRKPLLIINDKITKALSKRTV